MNSIDKLLQSYMDETAKAVDPVYVQARDSVLQRMQLRRRIRTGVLSTMALLLSVGVWWMLMVPSDYPQVIQPTEQPTTGIAASQSIPEVPDVVITPTAEPNVDQRGPRKESMHMFVRHDDSAVDQLISDNTEIAEVALRNGDVRQAAIAYFNLARTLDLHDRSDKVAWASEQALKLANQASDEKLINEISAFREHLSR